MPTRSDVITRALRRLRVVAMDESATTDQTTQAGEVLDGLMEELRASWGIFISTPDDTESVDDEHFLPLSYALSAQMAGDFGVASPESLARALVRLRAVANPDDREAVEESDDGSGGYY